MPDGPGNAMLKQSERAARSFVKVNRFILYNAALDINGSDPVNQFARGGLHFLPGVAIILVV